MISQALPILGFCPPALVSTMLNLKTSDWPTSNAEFMLNPDALNQLKQLKQEIRASKEIFEGTVKGTPSRFGFVILDDGRECFLPPDEMQKVFPGDRIRVRSEEHTSELQSRENLV